jgi:hypothetical protein
MTSTAHPVPFTVRREPIAACTAALFALSAADACAGIVTSCADDGTSGTLRSVIAAAAEDATIDMTPLHCSYISLLTGAIVVSQNNLTIQGPGNTAFPVSDNQSPGPDTIFYHTGTGTLVINDLYLEFGSGHRRYQNYALRSVGGGCIYSKGSVDLVRTRVAHCHAYSTTPSDLFGGAILANKNLTLVNSTISDSGLDADPSVPNPEIWGGGAFVGGNLTAKYSTIEYNYAGAANHGNLSSGGGLFVSGNLSISNSTIAHNSSGYQAGGIMAFGIGATSPATISNSTIANNKAPKVAGIYSYESVSINNSTIASNRNLAASGLGAGITFSPVLGEITVDLHSTLIADNAFVQGANRTNDDVAAVAPQFVTFTTDAQQGNFNLIRALDPSVSAASLPPDTTIGVCPLLGPLRDNGGPTWTMALYTGSPAINAGVNSAGLAYDQRGGPMPVPNTIPPPPLAYDRHSGPASDIGAYEYQYSDMIFSSAFDGCP